jgi:predicted NUDIX family NTP pyrophosphohydrolase
MGCGRVGTVAGQHSAGIVLFRRGRDAVEVLLGHMGGPYWDGKDDGAWSFPKGLLEDGEDGPAAARREFAEELGLPVPDGALLELGEVKQRSGKVVTLWAIEGDLDASEVVPGTFEMEWPPRSGHRQEFPEIDRAAWFPVDVAQAKLASGQRPFLDRLTERLQ